MPQKYFKFKNILRREYRWECEITVYRDLGDYQFHMELHVCCKGTTMVTL